MHSKRIRTGKFPALTLVFVLLTAAAHAGTNEGFTTSIISPTTIEDAAVGKVVSIVVEAQNVTRAKGEKIIVKYDANYLSWFPPFEGGTLIPNMPAFALTRGIDDEGLTIIEAGGSQLIGTPGSGTGTLGTLNFEVISALPAEGLFVSIVLVQVAANATDIDPIEFGVGEFGLMLVPPFTNRIIDLSVARLHDAAVLTWFSHFPGFEDVVRYRPVGVLEWQTAQNPLLELATWTLRADLRTLHDAGIDVQEASQSLIEGTLGRPLSGEEIATLRLLDRSLTNSRHLVPITGLMLDTEYEFEVRSTALGGQVTPVFSGTFRTRSEPDQRPLAITNFDVQATPTAAIIAWFTNRPADTRYLVRPDGGVPLEDPEGALIEDESGDLVHIAKIVKLNPDIRYRFIAGSRITGADELIESGLMNEADVASYRNGTFTTKAGRQPLRLLGPPFITVGPEEAIIRFELNQIATAVCEYGEVANYRGKVTRETRVDDALLYPYRAEVSELLRHQAITLPDLEPSTAYRFRLRAVTPDGDSVSTNPRGNEQWSKDWQFTTTAAGDTLPPVIVEGPQVLARGRYAVINWETDVETIGRVFFGTLGDSGTLGTPDEFEVVDRTPSGKPLLTHRHIISLTGLSLGTRYGYRIESTGANGRISIFDPTGSLAKRVGKRARLLQPPGGAGSFTTTLTPDTQFPVILSGPTVASKTHDLAVIEWTTDEPADSEVRFGFDALNDELMSGDSEILHKMVLINLEPGSTYNYIVGSTDPVGNGATESSQAVFTTSPEIDLIAPRFTSNPEVVYKNDRNATIEWSTDEETMGEVHFGTTPSLGFVRRRSTTGEAHEITLTNLAPNTQYFFKAISIDLSNNGPTESQTLSFTTDAQADLESPSISDIFATPTDSSAIINWSTNELADSYVEFGTDSLSMDFNIGDTQDVLAHEVVLTNLLPDTEYFIRVGSVDRANNPPTESEILTFTTLAGADTIPPSPPFDLSANAGNQQVMLSWDAELEFDLNGFNLYRRTGGGAFVPIFSGLRRTDFTDLNAKNGTAYEYRVTAIDRRNPPNESAPSNSVQATPLAEVAPTAPANLTRIGADYLRPTFVFTNSKPFSAGTSLTYVIQVSTRADFGNVTASTSNLAEGTGDVGPAQTAWTINRELDEEQTYYWRVRAVEKFPFGPFFLFGPFSETERFVATAPAILPGDFNDDNKVNFNDFFLFADNFGQEAGGELAVFDLNTDGTINFPDFFIFADNFGKSIPGKLWADTQQIDETAVVSVEAQGGGRAENRRVTVHVWAEEVERIKAFGLVLHYDPQAVEWLTAEPGPGHLLENQGRQAPLFQVLAQAPGQLVIGNGITLGEPVSGRGRLAELTFRVIGSANDAHFEPAEALLARSGTEIMRVQQVHGTRLLPQVYYLGANYPNPFNPSTSIEYALPEAGPVELKIYDVLGRRVHTLVREDEHPAGFYTAIWNGRDSAGRPAGSGVYFYRLQTPQFTRTYKMTLVK